MYIVNYSPNRYMLWSRLRIHGTGLSRNLSSQVTRFYEATRSVSWGFWRYEKVYRNLWWTDRILEELSISMELPREEEWWISTPRMDGQWEIPDAFSSSCTCLSSNTPRFQHANTPFSSLPHFCEPRRNARIKNSRRSERDFSRSGVNPWRCLWSSTFRYFLDRRRWGIAVCEEELLV